MAMESSQVDATATSRLTRFRKLVRFVQIYGLHRTLYKLAGRVRALTRHLRLRSRGLGSIGMVGCGQFAFSTIGYFLQGKCRVVACYDPNEVAATSFARFYGVPAIAATAEEVLKADEVDLVYIASNHASHAAYAVTALRAGRRVYVEKPVAVNCDQLRSLCAALRETGGEIFAGYNRPFSAALKDLQPWCDALDRPMTLSCFVSGHRLPKDHWYRNPHEGTRICGNVGHWIDLCVHLLHWGVLPDQWDASLQWSDPEARDDDLSISLASERGDLVSIVLSSRAEPFEGINETVNMQWGDTIAKIDDFRAMTVWKADDLKRYRYWPKDVGHRRAILQPFTEKTRDWHEVELSSLLMIHIAEMVKEGRQHAKFSFSESWKSLSI